MSFVHAGTAQYIPDWTTVSSDHVAPEVVDELPDGTPDVINKRMLQSGFVKIKTGLLSPTRYALLEHIAEIRPDEVHLRVEKDQLPT